MGDEGSKCQLSDIIEKLIIRQGQAGPNLVVEGFGQGVSKAKIGKRFSKPNSELVPNRWVHCDLKYVPKEN